jgi:hypothetical protein
VTTGSAPQHSTTPATALTGYFAATIDFGQGPLTSTGLNDIFPVSLEP